jgi:hypothetical protein
VGGTIALKTATAKCCKKRGQLSNLFLFEKKSTCGAAGQISFSDTPACHLLAQRRYH